jgi:putative membrane protein insertion efficiency factor
MLKKLLIFFIKLYKIFISPFLGNNCRFAPTCSEYAAEAIAKKGVVKGLYLSFCRILKCQPFSKKSGFDPVK